MPGCLPGCLILLTLCIFLRATPTGCLFGRWAYGNSIILDSLLYASTFISGVNASAFVDERLNSWLDDGNSSAFNISHNISRHPATFGQVPDIYPFVYLSQAQYHRQHNTSVFLNKTALLVSHVGAHDIVAWPKLWIDGLLTRDDEHASAAECWGGGPLQQNGGRNAACVWADDATMALTPVSREVAGAATTQSVHAAWQAWLGKQHSLYAKHLQDPVDGLFYHGQDASVQQHSCCKWSRANGWMMTAHVEVLAALDNTSNPAQNEHAGFAVALAVFRSHTAAIAKVQSADGRFYNLLNDTSTWLETSGTAMFAHSIAVGVLNGWLDRCGADLALARIILQRVCCLRAHRTLPRFSSATQCVHLLLLTFEGSRMSRYCKRLGAGSKRR